MQFEAEYTCKQGSTNSNHLSNYIVFTNYTEEKGTGPSLTEEEKETEPEWIELNWLEEAFVGGNDAIWGRKVTRSIQEN